MIVGVEGKPGAGKSFFATKTILAALKEGRKVYTNMDNILVRSYAWKVEKETKGKVTKEQVLDNFRVLRTQDLKLFHKIPKKELMNSTIVLDEVMLDFFSRDWQKTGKDLIFFFTQHRKYRCDFWYLTQSISKIDGVLREMTQYFVRMRNTEYFKLLFIKLPRRFIATWFYEDNETVVKTEVLKPDKGIFSYYDSWRIFENTAIPEGNDLWNEVMGRSDCGNIVMFPGVRTLPVGKGHLYACHLPSCPTGDCSSGCSRRREFEVNGGE